MTQGSDLTPTERGILFALMAAGRPLQESADLRQRYRLGMTATHRKRLGALGLIATRKSPFTHKLTEAGWQWVAQEMRRGDVPKGQLGQGALQAVLQGLDSALTTQSIAPEAFFSGAAKIDPAPEPDPAPVITGAAREQKHLENAAWNESEEALAFALQDVPSFQRVLARAHASAEAPTDRALQQVTLASKAVFQNLQIACAKRGLHTAYDPGTEVPFDPVYFDSYDDPKEGETVIVRKPPVVKSHSGKEFVVAKGVAEQREV